ncbi:hypothetical protein D3C71_2015360 [compost metagenome]
MLEALGRQRGGTLQAPRLQGAGLVPCVQLQVLGGGPELRQAQICTTEFAQLELRALAQVEA